MRPTLDQLAKTVRSRQQQPMFHAPYFTRLQRRQAIMPREHNEEVYRGFKKWYDPQQEDMTACNIDRITAFEYYNDIWNQQHAYKWPIRK